MKKAYKHLLFYAVLLGLWFLLAELNIWPPYIFPTPWGVGEAFYVLAAALIDHKPLTMHGE